jgi:hypothetical protein
MLSMLKIHFDINTVDLTVRSIHSLLTHLIADKVCLPLSMTILPVPRMLFSCIHRTRNPHLDLVKLLYKYSGLGYVPL